MRKKTINTELSDENLENTNGGTMTSIGEIPAGAYTTPNGGIMTSIREIPAGAYTTPRGFNRFELGSSETPYSWLNEPINLGPSETPYSWDEPIDC